MRACDADELATDFEEVDKATLLVWVMLARVIGDRLSGAGNTEPEHADDMRFDPSKEDTLDRGVENVKGGTAISLKWRGDPTTESMDGGRESTPTSKEFEEVSPRWAVGWVRCGGMLLKIPSQAVTPKALTGCQKPLIRKS